MTIVAGAADIPIDVFGGLVTEMAAEDLPLGVSPDCADVAWTAGSVGTRPGLSSVLGTIAGTPKVNYAKSYSPQPGTWTSLLLDSLGELWQEAAVGAGANPGVLALIKSGLAANASGKSDSQFGREYLALSDGKFGIDLPWQWEGTNLDRVSQVGPGAAPTAADAAAEVAINLAAAPTGAVRSNNIVTFTTSAAHGYLVGMTVTSAGVTDASFNGTFVILTVPSTTRFTVPQIGANATSGLGTVILVPQIPAGIHQVTVSFVTRQGYITKPAVPGNWSAAGSRRVALTAIPTGPSNIVSRIVMFTAAGGAAFRWLAATMVIADNTTTTLTLDFADTVLLNGQAAELLFRQVELGECAGVIAYGSRLFWWGERNKLQTLNNLTFDGGFAGAVPLGWTLDGVNGAGGSKESSIVAWGDAYRITGDGATAIRGLITQSAYQNNLGTVILAPKTSYSVRARVASGGALTQGTLHINIKSVSGAFTTTGLAVTFTQANAGAGAYAEFIGVLTPAQATMPSDVVLQVYADGTPNNNGFFLVDNIEIYPTSQPYLNTQLRASRVGDGNGPANSPESYDGISGLVSVAPADGQDIRCCQVIRETLYIVKQNGIYSTQDDGQNEPSLWGVAEVSTKYGAESVNGVAKGGEWFVGAGRMGAWIYFGTATDKISRELTAPPGPQTPVFSWTGINWTFGHNTWVTVDVARKRMLFGVPYGAATSPNKVLLLDYQELAGPGEIAAYPSWHVTYSGKKLVTDIYRKWTPWNITANCAALIERADGTAHVFLGNGAGTGKVYDLLESQLSDDGAAINSYYTTFYMPDQMLAQMLKLGSGMMLFTYSSLRVDGVGSLSLTAIRQGSATPVAIRAIPLANPAALDNERAPNVSANRAAWKFGTNATGSWFRLQKLALWLKPHPMYPVRGTG